MIYTVIALEIRVVKFDVVLYRCRDTPGGILSGCEAELQEVSFFKFLNKSSSMLVLAIPNCIPQVSIQKFNKFVFHKANYYSFTFCSELYHLLKRVVRFFYNNKASGMHHRRYHML